MSDFSSEFEPNALANLESKIANRRVCTANCLLSFFVTILVRGLESQIDKAATYAMIILLADFLVYSFKI